MKKFEEVRDDVKKNKKKYILIGVGGVALLVGGYFIGRKVGVKIGKDCIDFFTHDIGDVARDIKVTQPVPLPEGVSEIWKQIDEDVFVEIASDIENALIDNHIKEFHLDRSWDVADGVKKVLTATIETIEN